MKIITEHDPPPIPVRCHDWQAWVEGQEERGSGTGRTEKEAILDLLEKIPELWAVPAESLQKRIAKQFRKDQDLYSQMLSAQSSPDTGARFSSWDRP